METRNRVMKVTFYLSFHIATDPFDSVLYNGLTLCQATLGFFALPNEPSDIVDPLIDNLITLLCAILVTRYGFCHISMISYIHPLIPKVSWN